MSLSYVVDGFTELDSELFNPIIRASNNMRAGVANVLDYSDIDPTGNNSSSAGLAQMVAETQGTVTSGLGGIWNDLPSGEYVLTETLDLTRYCGRFGGRGVGQSPVYGTPGNGTVLRWEGPEGDPMIKVTDSRDVIFEAMRFEGNDAAPPSFAIEFHNPGSATIGTNTFFSLRDLVIGQYPWSTQGVDKGLVTSGIGWTGEDANNCIARMDRITVLRPDEYGLYMPNVQSVGNNAQSLGVWYAGVAGVYTGASIHLIDPEFIGCATDIECTNVAPVVIVTNIKSELSGRLAKTTTDGALRFDGGNVQLQEIIAGGEVMIDASPMDTLMLSLNDIYFSGNSDPSKARIEIGPITPNPVGNFVVDVKRCMNLDPTQLVFATGAAMWANSPPYMSKGVVEWQSTMPLSIHQFRNELRTAGTGTRTALDYAAWDAPVTD